MTLFQLEPSANAPCTNTIDVFESCFFIVFLSYFLNSRFRLILLYRKRKILDVERDQEQVMYGLKPRAANVCAAFAWEAKSFRLDDVRNVLRHGRAACDFKIVVMPSQQEIVPKIKILLFAMACNCFRKPDAQSTPTFVPFLPRLDLSYLETGHRHKKWSREIRPACVAVEICAMERIPVCI